MTRKHAEDHDNQALYLNNDEHNITNHAELNEYFLNIKNDLNQIERLIHDAVTNLIINFMNVNELHRSQQAIIHKITTSSTLPNKNSSIQESLLQQISTSEQIENELKSALISLQFGDLVSQLLTHTSQQVEVLNLALLDNEDIHQSEQIDQSAHKVSKALQHAQSSRSSKPVEHHEIQIGKIELF